MGYSMSLKNKILKKATLSSCANCVYHEVLDTDLKPDYCNTTDKLILDFQVNTARKCENFKRKGQVQIMEEDIKKYKEFICRYFGLPDFDSICKKAENEYGTIKVILVDMIDKMLKKYIEDLEKIIDKIDKLVFIELDSLEEIAEIETDTSKLNSKDLAYKKGRFDFVKEIKQYFEDVK